MLAIFLCTSLSIVLDDSKLLVANKNQKLIPMLLLFSFSPNAYPKAEAEESRRPKQSHQLFKLNQLSVRLSLHEPLPKGVCLFSDGQLVSALLQPISLPAIKAPLARSCSHHF